MCLFLQEQTFSSQTYREHHEASLLQGPRGPLRPPHLVVDPRPLLARRAGDQRQLLHVVLPKDGGIRFKHIDLRPDHWDLVELEGYDPAYAYNWFKEHEGRKYDILGILGFVFGPLRQDKKRFFCTEAIGHALKMKEPWRLDPNAMYAVVTSEK